MLKNKKHELFCQEYVKDGNGTKAYLRAGYVVKDDNVAKINASRLLTNANVKKRIAELMEKVTKRNDIEVDEILNGYKKIIDVGLKTYKTRTKNKKTIEQFVDAKNPAGVLRFLSSLD